MLLGYLFNGADWTGVFYVVELLYLSVVSILVAGCPDRRLLPTIAELYSVPTALWLLYIDFYGKYLWGRLVDGNLESNAWGLFGLSIGVAAFAHRSRIIGAFCLAVAVPHHLRRLEPQQHRRPRRGGRAHRPALSFDLRNRGLSRFRCLRVSSWPLSAWRSPRLRIRGRRFLRQPSQARRSYRGLGSGSTGRNKLWRARWICGGTIPGSVSASACTNLSAGNFSAHNAYLAMLADTGIFGFLWYMALMAWPGSACSTQVPHTRHLGSRWCRATPSWDCSNAAPSTAPIR